jgi:NitT/TauT family transport system substrate-binding protein
MSRQSTTDNILWGAPSFWINVLPVYYGEYKGFFQENGVKIDVKYFHGGPELAKAVKNGEAQIGNIGFPPFLKAFEDGLPAKIIGSSSIQRLDTFLVSTPEIQKMADLKGKRIGVLSVGSCDSYFIRYMFERESLRLGDVELIALQDSYGNLDVIRTKKVDATFLVEPMVTIGENSRVVHVLARVGDYFPRYQWCVLFGGEDMLRKNRDLVKRVLQAYRQSCKSIRDNPEECLEFGSNLFNMSTDLFKKALARTLENWEAGAALDIEGLENALQIQKDMGAARNETKKEDFLFQV